MGLYIEVPDKLGWLLDNGEQINVCAFTPESICDDEFLVVIVDNGPFYAAGAAFSERELEYILEEDNDPEDKRQRKYFIVKKDILKPVCPDWDTYVQQETL